VPLCDNTPEKSLTVGRGADQGYGPKAPVGSDRATWAEAVCAALPVGCLLVLAIDLGFAAAHRVRLNKLWLGTLSAKEALMADHRYHVIFNPNAGTALTTGLTTTGLSDMLSAAGLAFDMDDDDDEPLADRIALAIDGPADVIVAGGGDGTVLAVAEALLGTDKILAILPLGTLNGLARDLELPLDVATAIHQLPELEPRAVDVAEVNGRPFLHNVIIGLVPSIGAAREKIRGTGLRGKIGFLFFMIRRLTRARRIALALQLNGSDEARVERVQTLVVANNSYDQRFGRFMARRRLDRGRLTAYLIRTLRLGDAIRLAVEMILGTWGGDHVIEYEKVQQLTVISKKRRLSVSMDGEVLSLDTPLRFEVRPKSLSVLAPATATP
jgi:diacylglycerol kinase family enzyme